MALEGEKPGTSRIVDIFNEALGLPPDERTAFLEAACPDPALRGEVEKLLRSDAEAPASFLPSGLAAPLASGTRVGSYTLLACLGEGGMGTVYAARQDFPRRDVALKLIRPGRLSDSIARRFEQEVQALGSLQHPGIAQVFDAGTATLALPGGGVREEPFLAMELVRGQGLLEYAEAHGLDTRARLELLARVADAVHHAHQRGVVHRDLKPENVLVTEEETATTPAHPAQAGLGQPKVLDFGIARMASEGGSSLTRAGELVGTLSYMSPEQVEGRQDIDGRSDVYALGVIAYQLLASRLPHDFTGLSIPEAFQRLRTRRPLPLSDHDPRLRGDVSTIVGRALEDEAGRRYSSAAALAEDLRRHLRGAPIRARSNSTLYVLRRGLSRHKSVVAVAAAFLLAGGLFALQLHERRALARASDLQLRQALDSIAQFERFSVDYLQQSPEQRELLVSVLAQQRRLLEGHEDDAPGQLAAARTRAIVGVLSHVLGEAGAHDALLGAIDELEALRGSAEGVDAQLAMALKETALYHEQEGAFDLAEARLRRALELELVPAWRATLLAHLARLKRGHAKFDTALALYREALSVLEGEELPFEEMAYTTHWDCIGAIGSILAEQGRLDEAEEMFAAFDAMLPELDGVENPVFKGQAVVHLNNLANFKSLRDETDEIWPLMERALRFSEELLELSPDHLYFRRELAVTLLNLGGFLGNVGRLDEARTTLQHGDEVTAELVRSEPGAPLFRGLRGVLLVNLGTLEVVAEDFAAALPHYEEAVALLEPALAALPGHVEWLVAIPEARLGRAMCLVRMGRHDEGVRFASEAVLEPVDPQGWRRLEVYSLAIGAARADQLLSPEDRAIVIETYVELAIQHIAAKLDASSGEGDFSGLRDVARFPDLNAEPTYASFLELVLG